MSSIDDVAALKMYESVTAALEVRGLIAIPQNQSQTGRKRRSDAGVARVVQMAPSLSGLPDEDQSGVKA
jgi:hypothetical protein